MDSGPNTGAMKQGAAPILSPQLDERWTIVRETSLSDSLPPVIIFGGHENALPIVASLGARSVPVYVLNEKWSFVGFSRHARRIRLPPEPSYPQSGAEFLMGPESEAFEGSVLLAVADEEVETVSRHRETLARRFRLDLCNPPAQLALLDKLATYEAAREAGVPTPRYWKVQSQEDLPRLRDELVYPLIVKPKSSHEFQKRFDGKFLVVENFDELLRAFRVLADAEVDVLLVEKIPGPDSKLSSYYTYLDEDGNALFHFTKRIIRRYPKNMGLATYHVTDRVDHIREPALKLFRHVGLQGLGNAEFKYDDRDGEFKLMECNARFTAANTLIKKAGFDLGNFVYNRIAGIPQPPLTEYRTGLRQWEPKRDFLAFRELRRLGELTFMEWLRSVLHLHTFPFFSWRDPLPAVVRSAIRVGNRWKRRFSRILGRRRP